MNLSWLLPHLPWFFFGMLTGLVSAGYVWLWSVDRSKQ